MTVPERPEGRWRDDPDRLHEVIRRCGASRADRRAIAEQLREWYDRGVGQGPRARYNKLRAHLDRVASYVFAPGAARFSLSLPRAARDAWASAGSIVRDEFRSVWMSADADAVIALLVEWAFVYGATVVKVQSDPHVGFRLGYIQPWDFGVVREDITDLDEQDAFAHWYLLSIPQLRRWLGDDPRAESLLSIASEHAHTGGRQRVHQGLVVTNVTGTFPSGTVSGGFLGPPPVPPDLLGAVVEEPTVELVDLWERQFFRHRRPGHPPQRYSDWLVSTMIADGGPLLVQRQNPDLPWVTTGPEVTLAAAVPFVPIVPRPVPDLFWGRSELSDLRELQVWLDQHLEDLQKNVQKQLRPSKFFSGVPDFEEAGRAMDTVDGSYGAPEPNAKMQALQPQIGQAPFELIRLVERFFSDLSGIPESLSEPGTLPGGVRSEGHFGMIAGIGIGRIRRMALIFESALSTLATRAFELLQRHDATAFSRPDGPPFLLSQLPAGAILTVDAHSSAPIFAEQTTAKAAFLHRAGAITPEDLVDLVDPPNRDELRVRAIELAKSRAERERHLLAIQAARAAHGPGRSPSLR